MSEKRFLEKTPIIITKKVFIISRNKVHNFNLISFYFTIIF